MTIHEKLSFNKCLQIESIKMRRRKKHSLFVVVVVVVVVKDILTTLLAFRY